MLWLTIAVWLLLVAAGGSVLFAVGRSDYRKGKALSRELNAVSDRLAPLSEGLNRLAERTAAESTVFADPVKLRQEQAAAAKAAAKSARRARHRATRRSTGVR